MPPKFEVRDILRKLNQADLVNMLLVWDDGRMILEEGHIALKDEMKFAFEEVPGALRTAASGVETRRETAGCSGLLVCSP